MYAQVFGASAERISAGVVRLWQFLGVRCLAAEFRPAAARAKPLVWSDSVRTGRPAHLRLLRRHPHRRYHRYGDSAQPLYLLRRWTLTATTKQAKARDSFIERLTGTKPDQPRFTIIGSGSWSARANGAAALMQPSLARANEQLDPRQQRANTPPAQSTTPGLHSVSIHQLAPPQRTSDCSLLLICRPRLLPRILSVRTPNENYNF